MRTFICRSLLSLTLCAGPVIASPAQAAELAGKLAIATGQVTDTALDGSTRSMHDGDSVYAGDRLVTGDDSYADLDFEDGGRVLLRPGTDFQIAAYHYEAGAHEQQNLANSPGTAVPGESALFRLLKGGLSAISGLIGHVNHDQYSMNTAVATIGIRGTAYELRYCATDCGDAKSSTGAASQDGLYVAVDAGAIAVKNQAGESVTPEGKFAYVKDAKSSLQFLAGRPETLRGMELPDQYKKRAELQHRKILEERRRLREELREKRRHRHPGG